MPEEREGEKNTEKIDEDEKRVDLSDSEYYLNRELTKLEFQKRVLHEARNEENPLLERIRFLSIFTKNMDEFFMKRVGGLKQQMAANVTELTPDGRTPHEQWEEVIEKSREMLKRQGECYSEIRPLLSDEGIEIVNFKDLGKTERREMREYFEDSVLPTLTPLTFDPAHPFPFISNLSLSLGVLTRKKDESEPRFSRIKVPRNRPRLIEVSDTEDTKRYIRLEDLIAQNLDLLFPYVDILDHSVFRVTRNAEVRRNEEVAEDLIEMIEGVLRDRRFATVVRLEVEEGMADRTLETLTQQLELDQKEVFTLEEPLDFRDFETLTDIDRGDLKLPEWTPQPHHRLLDENGEKKDIFDEIRKKDILLHHPYHSFGDTVQRFLDEAARDDDVLAIKLAIYRTAPDSKVIESIIEAAQNGKQVAVMVELKARFDEENNLRWVERLEEEGIHVAYGTLEYKTHTKTALVVREENDGVRIYSHVATGNYHSETAKAYEDLGLLTADDDIGHDVTKVFNFFTGHSYHEDYRKLLVAPGNMREKFVELIRGEAEKGEDGRIIAKTNRLEDPEIVKKLYKASMEGVQIDLIVRDICRLRPGIEGLSENINVRSIVGRFLEHSRIYYFGNGGTGDENRSDNCNDSLHLIGSADWMTRNLDNRVEAIAPVEDPDLKRELDEILEILLKDNTKSWEMNPNGSYTKNETGEEVFNAQSMMMEKAKKEIEEKLD